MLKVKETDKFVLKRLHEEKFNFIVLPNLKLSNLLLQDTNYVFHISRFRKFIKLPNMNGNFFIFFFDNAKF